MRSKNDSPSNVVTDTRKCNDNEVDFTDSENLNNVNTNELSPEDMQGELLEKLESDVNGVGLWTPETERLVQQISLRYAHEILNALTPVYGILQMFLTDQDGVNCLEKKQALLKIAQEEIIKGKNHVNDFLTINNQSTPKPQWINMKDLKLYIETQIHRQSPEFIPHIQFEIKGNGEKEIYIDKKQLRLIIQLIVKKWIDFATEPSIITVVFEIDSEMLTIQMCLSGVDNITEMKDDEFLFYLHLINRNLKRNDGQLLVAEGLTLQYNIPKKVVGKSSVVNT